MHFGQLDVANAHYNPTGTTSPEEVVYDRPARWADAVLFSSVFTHMYKNHIFRYLSEARRIPKVGGRVLASFFLLDESWRAKHAAGETTYSMDHVRWEHCRYADEKDPLSAFGYDLDWMTTQVQNLGFTIAEPPVLGQWAQRQEATVWQDFLVLEPK